MHVISDTFFTQIVFTSMLTATSTTNKRYLSPKRFKRIDQWKVFISYSTPDLKVVHQLANQIRLHAEVYYWAESNLPGQEAWQSIFGWIDAADLVIVLEQETQFTCISSWSRSWKSGHSEKNDYPNRLCWSPVSGTWMH